VAKVDFSSCASSHDRSGHRLCDILGKKVLSREVIMSGLSLIHSFGRSHGGAYHHFYKIG
jgi:hypothetical protein